MIASVLSATLLINASPNGMAPVAAEAAVIDPAPWVWRQIGPAPIRVDNPESPLFGEGVGGVVYDIAIDPRGKSDRVIYLATNGGIWKSTDGGASWVPKTDVELSNSTGAVALDPDNPDTVYAGTGTLIDPAGINFKAVGLYKSTDGGDDWTVLGPNTFGAPTSCPATRVFTNLNTGTACGRGIFRIAVIPGMSNVVLVATNDGLWRSTLGGGPDPSGAEAWTKVLDGDISDLDVDTSTPTTVYASVSGVGVFRSIDAGATFPENLFLGPKGRPKPNTPPAMFPGMFGSIRLAQSSAVGRVRDPRNIYLNVANKVSCGSIYCPPLGIWKSDNRGTSWFKARAGGLGDCQQVCGVDQTIGVDPVNPDVVHVGGVGHSFSVNGARSFDPEDTGHPDQVAMAFSPHLLLATSPLDLTPIWVGNHGGLWHGSPLSPRELLVCALRGSGCDFEWRSKNEGLANLGVVSADMGRGSAGSNAYSYAAPWDNGLVSKRPSDPGNDWHPGPGGDGGLVTVDPNNPQRAYGASISPNDIFYITDSAGTGSTPTANDGWAARIGGSPAFDGPEITDSVWRIAVDAGSGVPGFTSQRVYALVAEKVYVSDDAGITFPAGEVRPIPGAVLNANHPRAIAISASDPRVVWLGMTDGTLRVSTDCNDPQDGPPTWQEPTDSAGNPSQPALVVNRPATSLAINPRDPCQVVVAYGLDSTTTPLTDPVWFTTDGGATWSDITGDLPALPVNSVLFDPSTSPASVIVADDEGVMYTTDASVSTGAPIAATWRSVGTGLPTVYSMQLAHDPGAVPQLVRVATYGRSVFELSGPLTDLRVDLNHDPPIITDSLTYHLFVTNDGSERAEGVVLRLELDPDLTFVSGPGCSAPPSDGSNVVTCRTPLNAPRESVKFDIVATVNKCPPDGSITTRASAGSLLLSDANPANNQAEDIASIVCPVLDTAIISAVDGDGADVPFFGKTDSTSIKFTFSGSAEAASFECSLDQANFTPCSSPTTYDNLLPGVHNFQVRALDANGNRDPTPATHIWTVL